MQIAVVLFIFCLGAHLSAATTWEEVQNRPNWIAAKKQIADHLADLAIPRIEQLLALPDLEAEAKASLLTLLGEARVRAGRPGEALDTLDDPALRDFSPAHQWRSFALARLGRYQDAIRELAKIDRQSMRPAADLQTGKLLLALGKLAEARPLLQPLLQSKKPALVKEATLQLISVALESKEADEVEALLASFQPSDPVEESLARYLDGRLHLLRGERLAAVGAFQTLLEPAFRKNLSSRLLHEITVALADSLALADNEEAGVASILETLTRFPDSPKIDDLFARLRLWSDGADPGPLRQKLTSWVPSLPSIPQFPLIRSGESASGLPPSSATALPAPSKRGLLSLEFLATTNLRSATPGLRAKGKLQFSLLQLLAPSGSALVSRGLLELGLVKLQDGNHRGALDLFSLLDEFPRTPALLRSYARSLAGQAAFALGNPTDASRFYLEAQKIAREFRQSELASLAALNAGITLLSTSRSRELDEITRHLDSPESRSFLVLERGLFLSSQQDPAARDLLISFLADFPDAPRAPEAALGLAESAIFTPPFDPALAREHLASLRFDPESQPTMEARRILVLLALNLNLRQAHDFLTRFPENPLADRVLFQLGQAYRNPVDRQNRELGKANLQFELLIDQYPDSPFVEPARYYSALTSVALKTESADTNARKRFRELIEGRGVLANEAALNLCGFLIDRNLQNEALREISTFLEQTNLPPFDRSRFLILGADAANQTGNHERALGYYRSLLEIEDLSAATRNRAHYIRGRALEKLGRTPEALAAYCEVVNRNFDPKATSSLEWKWFDKCGIEGALALLEKEERWQAAIKLAEKIGASGSPRARDAREIADRLALEHFIYRQRPAPKSGEPDDE